MFRHTDYMQFDVKPAKPDPVYARKLQELLGGAFGEMTVTMQALMQGWNCCMKGKYKDSIMDIASEEIGHVEMIATVIDRLLEGAPATDSPKNALGDPVVAAVMGGMHQQQAIVSGGAPTLSDSNGVPWNGKYVVASGNLLADFYSNVNAEAQGRVQTARLWHMKDDPGVKTMLTFNLARDTYHQNMWLDAVEELEADGLEGVVAPKRSLRRGGHRARQHAVASVGRYRVRQGPVGERPAPRWRSYRCLPCWAGAPGRSAVRPAAGPQAVRHLRRGYGRTARHARCCTSTSSRERRRRQS